MPWYSSSDGKSHLPVQPKAHPVTELSQAENRLLPCKNLGFHNHFSLAIVCAVTKRKPALLFSIT